MPEPDLLTPDNEFVPCAWLLLLFARLLDGQQLPLRLSAQGTEQHATLNSQICIVVGG